MTPESYARRIHERMILVGDPTIAASKIQAPRSDQDGHPVRVRVAEPQHSDRSILEGTGRTWDEWTDLIDAGPGRNAGHTEIAEWVHTEQGIPGWWAQAVTVGYERIAGLRFPGQMRDGMFGISRSRVLALDRDLLRELLLDADSRAELIPGFETELRSSRTSKALRFGIFRDGESVGALLISTDLLPNGRIRLAVAHEKLPSFAVGTQWKVFWTVWLDAVADAAAADAADAAGASTPPVS